MHFKIEESLVIRDLKPAFINVGSEKLYVYCKRIFLSFIFVVSPAIRFSGMIEIKFICN